MFIVMLTCTIALLLACMTFAGYELLQAHRQMQQELATLTSIIGENSTAALAFNDPDAAEETLAGLHAVQTVSQADIYTREGALFASYRRADSRAPLLAGPREDGFRFDQHYLSLHRSLFIEEEPVGSISIQSDVIDWQAQLIEYGGIVAIALLLSSLVALLLSAKFQQTISQPIQHLSEAAHRVSKKKDYAVRVEEQGQDELGQLTKTFNEMLAQIQHRDIALVAAKEEAEEMVRLKSTFLTNMSHEIRTPLTGIIGYAQILAGEVAASQAEFVEVIEQSGMRLMDTLNSILDLSQLEAGGLELEVAEIDLASEIEEVTRLLLPLAREKNLRLRTTIRTPNVRARLDQISLNRLLNNLIRNAIKFTEKGEVVVCLETDEHRIYIHVQDTGVGISPAFIPYLFDEFRQESQGLTRSYEGNGLGLAITKRLIELMGGEITVESEKEQGSRFTVSFPKSGAGGSPVEDDFRWQGASPVS